MLHRLTLVTLACAVLLSVHSARGADLTLTAGAPANVVIVVPEKENLAYTSAANLLAKRIEQALGRKVKVVKESEAGKADLAFQVGPTAASLAGVADQTTLPAHGYEIKTDGKANVFFAAKDDFAVGFAVTEFAERVLNIRQYMPAPLGECITKTDKVVIPGDFSVVSKPDYASVWLSGVSVPPYKGIATGSNNITPYKEMDLAYQCYWSDKFHHAMHDIFPPLTYGKTHPEYYPARDGKRAVPIDEKGKAVGSGWQPCLSNPEVSEVALKYCLDFFKDNPSLSSVSIAINDGGGYCQCDQCLAKEKALGGTFEDLYLDFANRLARELQKQAPGKSVGFLRYGKVNLPPRNPVEKNVLVYIVHPGSDGMTPWAEKGASTGIYTWLYGFNYVTPRYYPHEYQKFMKTWKEQGAVGFYGEGYPTWIIDAPMLYTAVKIARHLDTDPEAILKQYATDMFGAAGPDVVKFYHVTEAAMERRKSQKYDTFEAFSEIARPIVHQFICWRTEDVAAIDAALADAAGKVTAGAVQAQRLELLSTYWSLSREYILSYALAAQIAAMPHKTAGDIEAMLPLIGKVSTHVAAMQRVWAEKFQGLLDAKTVATRGLYLRGELVNSQWEQTVAMWIDPAVWPYVTIDQSLGEAREALTAKMGAEKTAALFKEMAGKDAVAAPYLGTQATLAMGELKNLAPNGSFEEADPAENGHAVPAGYKLMMSKSAFQKDVGLAEGEAHSGKNAFRQGEGGGGWLDLTMPIQPGRYIVRVWVKQSGTESDARMNFLVFNKEGKMTKVIYNYVSPGEMPANEWRPLEATVTIPEDCDKMSIDIYTNSPHAAGVATWFDDLMVAKVY